MSGHPETLRDKIQNSSFEEQKQANARARAADKAEKDHGKALDRDMRRMARNEEHTRKLVELFPRENLPELAAAAAGMVFTQVLAGDIVMTSRDVAPFLKSSVEIMRLESGEEPGTNIEISYEEAIEEVKDLRDEALAPELHVVSDAS